MPLRHNAVGSPNYLRALPIGDAGSVHADNFGYRTWAAEPANNGLRWVHFRT